MDRDTQNTVCSRNRILRLRGDGPMKQGLKVQVSFDAPYHKGRIGIFQYISEDNVAVVSIENNRNNITIISVDLRFLLKY